jgi:SMC interacting uncharacterized protein involved in chromosome segregation
MVLFDDNLFDVINELGEERRKDVRTALNYNWTGETVSMCSTINQSSVAQQCMSNQDYVINELMPELKKLKRHDDRITTVERTTNSILRSVEKSANNMEALNESIIRMLKDQEHYSKDFDKIEARLKQVEDDKVKSDNEIVRIGTKQNIYMGIAGTLSLAVVAIVGKVYIK